MAMVLDCDVQQAQTCMMVRSGHVVPSERDIPVLPKILNKSIILIIYIIIYIKFVTDFLLLYHHSNPGYGGSVAYSVNCVKQEDSQQMRCQSIYTPIHI